MMIMLRALLTFASMVMGAHSSNSRRPNFIFFQPDEMRAESLGCYGHPVSRTPNFDKFASEATRFEQAHVSYTVCSQSRVSFVTGWPTHVAGHRSLWSLLRDWEPNLFKYFKNEGYTVKWWGKNDMLAADSWNRSVTSAVMKPSKGNAGPSKVKYGEPGYYSFLNDAFPWNQTETADHQNVKAAIDFLHSKPTEPFVIFLPVSLPHPPYSAPEPWYSSIDPDSLPPLKPVVKEGKPDYHELIREYRALDKLDDAFFRRLHAVYLGSISYSDYLFGQLLEAIKVNDFEDSTTVAMWSDHGDYAGDYGLVEKWPSGLEDVLTRVPLLIRTPGGVKGHVIKEPVQLFDIVPTFLEIANITANHVHFARSLVPQLKGSVGDPSRAVFSEGGYGTHEPRANEGDACHDFNKDTSPKEQIYYPKSLQQLEHPLSVARAVSARTLTHKLILRTDPSSGALRNELYDLQRDPQMLVNQFDNETYSEVRRDLKETLLTWYMQTSDALPWHLDGRFQHPDSLRFGPMIGGTRGPHDFVETHAYDKQGDWPDVSYHV